MQLLNSNFDSLFKIKIFFSDALIRSSALLKSMPLESSSLYPFEQP